ncbi:MAG TPA: glycosyltransferase family 2 protein [Anaerolineae bacterium]|nr:glycosyltransferase family 2 protein [Anaerolineae bacterium]
MNEDKILALIPAWNEEAFIRPVIEAARAHLPVLVVDDGSQDRTPELAASVGAEVVRHEENKGKGQALITGFKWTLAQGFDAVVTLDADGQHDPAEIPIFISAYQNNAGELIIGRRDFRQMPFPNRYANPIGSWLLSLALKQRIYDNQCGYRCHTRKLLESLDLKTTGFELEVEVVMQTVCLEMTIGWVPIRTIYGTGKISYFHPLHDTLGFLKMVWYAYQYRRRFLRRYQGSS